MRNFEEIEEHRERVVGLEYELAQSDADEAAGRLHELADVRAGLEAEAYELADPKHPDHHGVLADIWDAREGK